MAGLLDELKANERIKYNEADDTLQYKARFVGYVLVEGSE